MKDAYDADKNTLRLVDLTPALVRTATATKRSRSTRPSTRFCPTTRSSRRARRPKGGQAARAPVRNAEQGAAEVLYGLGAAGGRRAMNSPQ